MTTTATKTSFIKPCFAWDSDLLLQSRKETGLQWPHAPSAPSEHSSNGSCCQPTAELPRLGPRRLGWMVKARGDSPDLCSQKKRLLQEQNQNTPPRLVADKRGCSLLYIFSAKVLPPQILVSWKNFIEQVVPQKCNGRSDVTTTLIKA